MKTNWNHENVILQEPVTTGLIISSIIGAGSSVYAANEQARAQEEAEEAQREAEMKARMEADRIAAEARPEGEAATTQFGSGKKDKVGSTNDFLAPRMSTGLSGLGGTSATGGLGFS